MGVTKSPMRLGRTACMVMVFSLILGYIVIFYSVFHSSSSGAAPSEASEASSLHTELERERHLVSVKNIELARLRKELAKAHAEMNQKSMPLTVQPPAPPPVPPQASAATVTIHAVTRPGVIVLGMHRSGTSVVGGLLNQMGMQVGGPLIGPAVDNAKGFFERIDVVLQNDYLMRKQQVHYAFNTQKFDAHLGLKHILEAEDTPWFDEGRKGLAFLNNPKNFPWMLKDPRLCITLRTWIPLLPFVPAVLFTYRHPLDVALSLSKREEEHFKIARGLKMWYVYNMRAIQNSNDLCRVVAAHKRIMSQPQVELDRIFDQLHECGVAAPRRLQQAQISGFVDSKLQHGRTTLHDDPCVLNLATLTPPDTWPTTEVEHVALYREVMRAYCAMEDGSAFSAEFAWKADMTDA